MLNIGHETTTKDFKLFKKVVNKWIKRLGLYGWTVEFVHDKSVLGDGMAGILPDLDARTVVFMLASEWPIIPKKRMIKLVAFHEVAELLLFRLNTLAKGRYVQSQYDIDEEIHNVIKILENRIFKRWELKKKERD